MAIVKKIDPLKLEKDSRHTDVNCTYSIISDEEGNKFLQIDTYGSAARKIPGKKVNLSDSALKPLQNSSPSLKENFSVRSPLGEGENLGTFYNPQVRGRVSGTSINIQI